MPRLVPSPVPRARGGRPAQSRRSGSAPPPPPAADDVALQLAIGREGIGLELARPARVGCLRVTDLAATLPGLRFPVDVSGGVPRFRHRRGELQRLEVELGARPLERYLAPRLRGVVGTRTPEVWVEVRRAGAALCVASTTEADEDAPRVAPVVAFEVEALAEGEDVVLVVERARGVDLPAPATALAIACVEAVLGSSAERSGASFVVRRAAAALARALMPEAGARVPSADEVRWTSLGAQGDAWVLHAMRGAVAAAPGEQALRAREVALLLREGDDALVRGDLAAARALYVEALDHAPRHVEIVRRIVELDARDGGRAEAALAMLTEAAAAMGATAGAGGAGAGASGERDARLGTTAGELLAQTGDVEAAVASLERAGETEPAPALAARAFALAARLARDPEDAARWLDRAVARAPRATPARWMRVTKRLQLGRLEDATADVEHLEALARGGRAKHAVWLRAGRAWQAAGLAAHAGGVFERALRYAPDEPRALSGLGAALVAEGRSARGAAVLARALELAEARGEPSARIRVELARALAEHLDDLPTAVAHVAAIGADAPEAPLARGLEGRWRGRLGDLAGASLAFARLRELASSAASGATGAKAPNARGTADDAYATMAALLLEAAELARTRLGDALGAQRHLAAALRLRPHDPELRRAYREVGAIVARADAPPPEAGDAEEPLRAPVAFPSPSFAEREAPSATHRTLATERVATDRPLDLALASEPPDPEQEAVAAARVEELTRRLHADPTDDAVADELSTLLASLGRGHELLGLLMARLDDASPERRAVLAPRARATLERLAADAEAAGRAEEAALFRGAADALPKD